MRLQPSAADGAIDKSQREREGEKEREITAQAIGGVTLVGYK